MTLNRIFACLAVLPALSIVAFMALAQTTTPPPTPKAGEPTCWRVYTHGPVDGYLPSEWILPRTFVSVPKPEKDPKTWLWTFWIENREFTSDCYLSYVLD